MRHPERDGIPCARDSSERCLCCRERLASSTLLHNAVEENERLRQALDKAEVKNMVLTSENLILKEALTSDSAD